MYLKIFLNHILLLSPNHLDFFPLLKLKIISSPQQLTQDNVKKMLCGFIFQVKIIVIVRYKFLIDS